MRLVWLGILVVGLTACDLKSAFTGNVEIVAQAGALELPSDSLAGILADGKWPITSSLAEQFAHRWVEFALLSQRFAQGDSLLDSATVFHAMWADATQRLVDYYHDSLVAGLVNVDSATVDSAYRAGEHRLIYHVLIRTRVDMSPPAKQEAQVKAGRILSQLRAGMPWEEANQQNEDPVARRAGGSIGVLVPGTAAPEFEQVAFQLPPGGLSDVVETQYGFHIVWRPELNAVWDEYQMAVEDELLGRIEDQFLADLEVRWNVRVRSNGPEAMRQAAAAPLQTFTTSSVIGDYRGGEFTTADMIRWALVLPEPVMMTVTSATDEQLIELARTLIRNEALIREALDSGVTYKEEDFPELRDRLRVELEQVWERLQLDSALAGVSSPDERLHVVDRAILDYLHGMATDRARGVVVPAFVADRLRNSTRWRVSSVGIDQVAERAEALRTERAARENTRPAEPAEATPDVTPDSGSDASSE